MVQVDQAGWRVEMKVYKCVHITDQGCMVSAIAHDTSWALDYEIGKDVTPINGYIYTFKSFLDALRFMVSAMWEEKSAILECETETMVFDRAYAAFGVSSWGFEKFWMNYTNRASNGVSVPFGTIWCEKVKPVKVIEKFTKDTYITYKKELFGVGV